MWSKPAAPFLNEVSGIGSHEVSNIPAPARLSALCLYLSFPTGPFFLPLTSLRIRISTSTGLKRRLDRKRPLGLDRLLIVLMKTYFVVYSEQITGEAPILVNSCRETDLGAGGQRAAGNDRCIPMSHGKSLSTLQ